MRPHAVYALAAISATGLATALGQIILLRELLTLFSGFEAAAGTILCGWLAWTGLGSATSSRLIKHRTIGPLIPGLVLIALALALPGTLLTVRAARMIWGTPMGEFPSLTTMLSICFLAPGFFCFLSGMLFSLVWAMYGGVRPVHVYAVEAFASALAGLLFYFLLLPRLGNLEIAFLGACAPLAASAALLRIVPGLRPMKLIWLAASMAIVCPWPYMQDIEITTRHWQWGPNAVAVTDSAYQNLALIRQENQWTLFADGNWFFSAPDKQSAEWTSHPAMAYHHAPEKVLLMGGDPYGVIREILQHPSVLTVDYVEPDPSVLYFTQHYLPDFITKIAKDPRVRPVHQDAARFVESQNSIHNQYDVILLNLPEPVNAQLNRFYSLNFYRTLQNLLSSGGLVALGIPASQEALGSTQTRSLKQVYATLTAVFPYVETMPGDRVQFFASNSSLGPLAAEKISSTLAERGIEPTYVKQFALADVLSPFRRDYLSSLLQSPPEPAANTSFHPACYLNALHLWSLHGAENLGRFLSFLESVKAYWLWGMAALLGLLALFVPKSGSQAWVVSSNVAFAGGSHMAAQLVLLLGYQIMAGNLFSRLAVLIASSMTGLALGSALAGRWTTLNPAARLFMIQLALGTGLGITAVVLPELHPLNLSPALLLALFCMMAIGFGILGGLHFALAVSVRASGGPATALHGGGLYGWDLAGAALSSLLTPLFLVPIWGLITPLFMTTVLCFAGSAGILRLLHRT